MADEHEGLRPEDKHIHRGDSEFDETYWVSEDEGHDFDNPESQSESEEGETSWGAPQEPLSAAEQLMENENLRHDDPRVQELLLDEDEDQRRGIIQRLERRYKAKVKRHNTQRAKAIEHAKASERLRQVAFKEHEFEGWKEREIPYKVEPKQILDTPKDDILPPEARGDTNVVHPDDIRDVEARLQSTQKLRDELEGGKGASSTKPPRFDTKAQRVQAGIPPKREYDPTKDKGSFNKVSAELRIKTLKEKLKPYNNFLDPSSAPSSEKVLYDKGELTSERLILHQQLKHAQAHLTQINESLDRYDKQIKQLKSARQELKKRLKQQPASTTPRSEPVRQAPNPTQLKQEVAEYNQLRNKDQKSILTGGLGLRLTPQEEKRYQQLKLRKPARHPSDKIGPEQRRSKRDNSPKGYSYDEDREFEALDKRYKEAERYTELETKFGPNGPYNLVVQPTENQRNLGLTGRARTPDEEESERLQNALEGNFPVEQKGKKPKTRYIDPLGRLGDEEEESVEGEIGKYGQEKAGASWKNTYNFNKEQLERKYKGLVTGEGAVGFGEQGKKGYEIGVPPEKAKATLGPNAQVIKHTGWKPVNPDEALKGYDKFEVELANSTQPEEHYDEEGRYYKQGHSLKDTLDSMGLELETTGDNPTPKDASGTKYTIKTKGSKRSAAQIQSEREHLEKEGELSDEEIEGRLANETVGSHLNPDQIAYLEQQLHLNYGVKSFKPSSTIKYSRQSFTMPVGYNKLPKGVSENDVVRSKYTKNLYTKPIGTRFGERDDRGELLPGQSDTVGIRIPGVHKVGERALQYNFREDTDSIGWGRSYRPGSKEVSAVALAFPRAHRQRQIMEATQTNNQAALDEIIEKEHPEAETEEDRSLWRDRYKRHGRELVAAAAASGYYSTKKGLPRKVGGKIWYSAARVPAVKRFGERTNIPELFKDSRLIHTQLSNKMHRAKLRVLNPTANLDDPTRYGITKEGKLNIPKLRYRKLFISSGKREGRKLEKDAARLKGAFETRQDINKFLRSPSKNIFNKWEAAAAYKADPEERMGGRMLEVIHQKRNEIQSYLDNPRAAIGDSYYSRKDNPKLYDEYKGELEKAKGTLDELIGKIDANPEEYSTKTLEDLYKSKYSHALRTHLPKPVRIGGEIALGSAVLGGGTIYAVDKYQTYKHNKGEHINHPILKSITPETISIPKLKVKKTRDWTIPDNAVTNALDFEGMKVPTAWRASVVKEQKARLRNHKDISGQGYESGLPILGGVGVTAPTTPKGSIKEGLISQSPEAGLGPTKNMYIKGKKVPIDISMGKKERWDQKSHKLRAKYNRFKLSEDDRDKLVYEAAQSPERREQIKSFYYGDKILEEKLDDPAETARVQAKLAKNKYTSGGKKNPFTPIDKYTTRSYEQSHG